MNSFENNIFLLVASSPFSFEGWFSVGCQEPFVILLFNQSSPVLYLQNLNFLIMVQVRS